ncbi:4Fe-4S dicluster domain-containing protein [Acetobacterium woodii]|uniref:Hydrogenase Fe-S subunit HycB3 n=1 Tax=Acetobacterium woodii (strain ATCC 29683 / DSM 1030 / JCM 2381 / KCTC 1655 / WB1) TaxID=931626 RepID=H6LB64_ACEWD|nr:4Fe-4S dicluster domain-containing protein [Acetobacterium woodii]AFA47616.1 hydrogenase Fe-S subunit HycB3 [Acetobacterium woodii DSM 1030]
MNNNLGSFVVACNDQCTGCKACEIACFTVHNQKENKVAHTVGTVAIPVTPRLFLTKFEEQCLPIQCKQCEDAPCLNSCAAKAITKVDGTMIVNEMLCIGCKNCMLACPFGAIEMLPIAKNAQPVQQIGSDEVRKSAFKCDLCAELEDGPACVKACPHDVLKLMNLEEDRKEKSIRAAIALTLTGNL